MSIRDRPSISDTWWAAMHARALEHADALAGTDRARKTYGAVCERPVLGLLVSPPPFRRAQSGPLGVVASSPEAPGWVGRFVGSDAGEAARRHVAGYLEGSFAVSHDAPDLPHPFGRLAWSSNVYTCDTALALWPPRLDIEDIALAVLLMRVSEAELW